MFGISFSELLVVTFIAIVFIKPEEYGRIIASVRGFYQNISKAYSVGKRELENIKKEFDIKDADDAIKKEIAEAEEAVKKIVGDDGKEYDAYDISEELEKKNEK